MLLLLILCIYRFHLGIITALTKVNWKLLLVDGSHILIIIPFILFEFIGYSFRLWRIILR